MCPRLHVTAGGQYAVKQHEPVGPKTRIYKFIEQDEEKMRVMNYWGNMVKYAWHKQPKWDPPKEAR